MAGVGTTLYLPDLILWEGAVRADLALEVDAAGAIVRAVPAAEAQGAVRLRGRALLPAMVNAHSHAFQRLIRGRTEYVTTGRESDDFWSWRESMYRAAEALGPEEVYVVSRQAFLEMALAGIGTVGEFHYLHHDPEGRPYADRNELALQVIRAARDVGLRIALLRVGYARAGFEVPPNPRQRRFIDPDPGRFIEAAHALREQTRGDVCVTVGLAPHSVRAVSREWLRAVARERGDLCVHMHVAEQPAEIEACLREHRRRPVELVEEMGLLGPHFTGVHAIHLAADEIRSLGAAGANVCACPGTERNLGDGVVPADALLEAGVHLSLGSDSQANIDLLDDARQLEGHLRLVRLRRAVLDPGGGGVGGLGARLWAIATEGGARSLGVPSGTLRPGAPADFVTVDLSHPSVVGADAQNLLAAIVFGAQPAAIRDVFVNGRQIVADGRHPLQQESGRAFTALAGKVFG
ncbi:MAG: formimidoylglutamate deiminase [Myxococcaceae bacterium]|nr:formimidoylglutamate deiminase [Myxococcaceae bacterium]